jgi:hypothetical protein
VEKNLVASQAFPGQIDQMLMVREENHLRLIGQSYQLL